MDDTDLPDENDWRLAEISRIQNRLEEEARIRERIYKKYKRACNTVDWIDYITSGLSVGLGATSVALTLSILGSPAVPLTTSASAFCVLTGAVSKIVARKLRTKAQKHDRIRQLADAKRDSISLLISRALSNGQILQCEYTAIVREMEQYNDMKTVIRKGAQKKNVETAQQELVELDRNQARVSFLRRLSQ